MINANENNHAPKLDRAKIRKFREIARLRLEDCVLESCLEEDWRKVERGEILTVCRETLFDIAVFLGCDTEDLLTEKCSDSDLPELIDLCDSENWVYSPEPKSGMRLKVNLKSKSKLLTINCGDASPEEMENIWDMLTKRVTT